MDKTRKHKSPTRTPTKYKKRARPDELPGYTHKLNVPNGFGDMVNLYITITHDERDQPFEMFINCSDQFLYEWLTSIMRLVSADLRRGISPLEVAEELKQIHSPSTSHFIPGGQGLCPSLPARIGLVLEQHYMKQCP